MVCPLFSIMLWEDAINKKCSPALWFTLYGLMTLRWGYNAVLLHWQSQTLEQWRKLECFNRTPGCELTERQLHKEYRHTHKYQHNKVWDEECPASITVIHKKYYTIQYITTQYYTILIQYYTIFLTMQYGNGMTEDHGSLSVKKLKTEFSTMWGNK